MKASDRERAVLIKDLCKRLGLWATNENCQPFSQNTMQSIREDAERLVELLDARELSLVRKQVKSPNRDYNEER